MAKDKGAITYVPVNAEDADAAAEAELARQFAQTQQQRYSGEQPAGANPFSLDDFEFSPMKALLDDGPRRGDWPQ